MANLKLAACYQGMQACGEMQCGTPVAGHFSTETLLIDTASRGW